MPARCLSLLLFLPVPALAGLPGEGEPIVSVHAAGVSDSQARTPVGLGAEVRAAIPLSEAELVPDLEFRAGLVHTRLPPAENEAFILANPGDPDAEVPDAIRFSRWESRLHAFASWGATDRGDAPRVRAGVVGLIDGTAGASRVLDPLGWSPDYTASFRAGPSAAVGWALPLGEDIGDPLLDVRVGASVLVPLSAGGGLLAGSADDRDFVLVVEDGCDVGDCVFGPAAVIGRETRAWAEGTLTVDHFVAGLELGLEHNARSAVTRARGRSPVWDTADLPEQADPYVRLTVGWMF
jgi:hypothetical protein